LGSPSLNVMYVFVFNLQFNILLPMAMSIARMSMVAGLELTIVF
jgi:hypothetical protein